MEETEDDVDDGLLLSALGAPTLDCIAELTLEVTLVDEVYWLGCSKLPPVFTFLTICGYYWIADFETAIFYVLATVL